MSENENNTPKPQGDPAELGDAGKAALAAERKRADDAEKAKKDVEKKLADIESQGLSDLDKARKEIDTLKTENARLTTESGDKDLTITRLNVGIGEGLPANLIARLQGTDEASFKTDATSLKELVPANNQSPFPKADPSQGSKEKTGGSSTADLFATAVGDVLK